MLICLPENGADRSFPFDAPGRLFFSYLVCESRYALEYVSPLDAVVIVDGVPVVGADRMDKLQSAIVKAVQKEAGIKLSKQQLDFPLESDGQSKGFMFVTLSNPAEAQAFQRTMHEYKFDKRHTFSVVLFSDVDKYSNVSTEWKEPEAGPWQPRVRALIVAVLDCSR